MPSFDFSQGLRQRNVFGNSQPQTPWSSVKFQGRPDITRQREVPQSNNSSTEEGPMTSNYRKFLGEGTPKREDFQPTKMDRLGSILSGVAAGSVKGGDGYGTARNQLDEPYNKAMKDRLARGNELEAGANLENSDEKERYNRVLEDKKLAIAKQNADSLESNRDSLADSRTRRLNLQEKIADGRATDAEKQEYRMLQIAAQGENQIANTQEQGKNQLNNTAAQGDNQQTLEASRQANRVALDKIKQEHPGWVPIQPKGGKLTFIDPKHPEVEPIVTNVDTGTLSDEDIERYRAAPTESESTREITDANGVVQAKSTTKTTSKKVVPEKKTSSTSASTERPKQVKDPNTGETYDTSKWTETDWAEAKKAKWF